ncbi:MAG TPA: hypothetical protein VHE30_00635 [Polyangiaceae bacterium]|nr:hypothetical protein [Polyangiaceae bacterium]
MPASRPSFPSEPHSRRLGTGGGPSGGERLLRAQLVIALVLGFTILAVILYLWRRPSGKENQEAAVPSASSSAGVPEPTIVRTKVEPPKAPPPHVKTSAVQHLKCGASPKATAADANLCDSLPSFEQSLTKAIVDTAADCVPVPKEEGTINFVLTVDFRNHDARVYPGRSGSWKGKQAKKAAECVKHAMTAPNWETMSHQYRYYMLSVLATYPAESTMSGLPTFGE